MLNPLRPKAYNTSTNKYLEPLHITFCLDITANLKLTHNQLKTTAEKFLTKITVISKENNFTWDIVLYSHKSSRNKRNNTAENNLINLGKVSLTKTIVLSNLEDNVGVLKEILILKNLERKKIKSAVAKSYFVIFAVGFNSSLDKLKTLIRRDNIKLPLIYFSRADSNLSESVQKKLWVYFLHNLFGFIKKDLTLVNFKIYEKDFLLRILNRQGFSANFSFELQLLIYTLYTAFLDNINICCNDLELSLSDNLPQKKISEREIVNNIKHLCKIHKELRLKDDWSNSFSQGLKSINLKNFKILIDQCPSEIVNLNIKDLINYKKITIFELLALGCKSVFEAKKEKIPILQKNDFSIYDCWYISDSPDATCSHLIRNEVCPVTIPCQLSKSGIVFYPKKILIDLENLKKKHKSIINNINKPFYVKGFSISPSPPISIGYIEDKKIFSKPNLMHQPQNIPIKMPFSEYRLPTELKQFEEAVRKITNYWHSINERYADYYYCYLSVAQSKVPPNCYQRRGHIHSDGFQSYWLTPKLFSDFTFIVSDTAITEFFLKGFEVSSLDPSKHNYFKYFAKKMDIKSLKYREPYEIMAMDAYTLHKATRNESNVALSRTFVRVMYSVIRWNGWGNSVNPMFEYSWPRVERFLLKNLI